MKKNFYSIQEAADYLQVDYKVVYRLVKDGKLPSTRVSWQYRLTEEELVRYLEGQRVRQIVEANERPAPSTDHAMRRGIAAARAEMLEQSNHISRLKARQMEQNFVNRFVEKVTSIGTIRHPATGDLMTVVKWEEHQEILEDREAMMVALNSAFLDRRTLATTPRNTIVRFTVPDSPVLVLEGRFVSHLDTLCTGEKDGQPGTLEDLLIAIDECEERQRIDQAFMVTGLASPTGWDEEAIGYISSSGRGNTYRNRNVHIYLIDLGSEAVYFDDEDSVTASFAGLFRLATDQEDVSSLAEQLRAHLSDRNGVILADYARDLAVSEEMAIAAAYRLQESGNYRVIDGADEGPVIVRG